MCLAEQSRPTVGFLADLTREGETMRSISLMMTVAMSWAADLPLPTGIGVVSIIGSGGTAIEASAKGTRLVQVLTPDATSRDAVRAAAQSAKLDGLVSAQARIDLKSLPYLHANDYLQIGPANIDNSKPMSVMGPGTGMGVALCIPADHHFACVATEGGHTGLAPGNEQELVLFSQLLQQQHVISRELLLCGAGLCMSYSSVTQPSEADLTH